MMSRVLCFFCGLMFLNSAATAQAQNSPLTLFESGDYLAAMELGESQGTGESLSIAARAALADANLRATHCFECLERAEKLALAAIAANPERAEPYIYLASALGFQSRIVGLVNARLSDFPDRAKEAIDTALRLEPENAWAMAALGGWHFEVVTTGGRWLGSLLYNASITTGESYFARAIAADPGNPLLRYEYVLALSSYDLRKRRDVILQLLNNVMAMAPRIAFERAIQTRARVLADLLAKGDTDAYRALVSRYQGYP